MLQRVACPNAWADNGLPALCHRRMSTGPSATPSGDAPRWIARRKEVGARIRELRLEAGLTQEALALESGMSRNHIIYLEWGRHSVLFERLFDIAQALDVPVTALFDPPSGPPVMRPYRGGRRPMDGGRSCHGSPESNS